MKKMSYDSENKLYYAFKKDSNFLYMAIYKNENALKYSNGGVQLFFNAREAKKDSLMLTFAHTYTDSVTRKLVHNTHDYFLLENFNGIKKQLVPKFNETGILLEWNYTNIDYLPRTGNIDVKNIKPNPNVFSAEIQIPIGFLQTNYGNALDFAICLRGGDTKKEGKEALERKRLFPMTSAMPFQNELIERLYFTEFEGILNLNTIH
ncbi:hypothetical protein [Pedobacter sp. MW01-1-1]|uniref:hypothetical protein n=1 Tax=Pedobacter sp. MW01-1-1 TaxID=3383027 RepID=UPI003FF12BF3